MSVVAEFAAMLGLEPDEKSFEHGEKLLEGIKKGLEVLGVIEAVHEVREFIGSTVELGASLVDTSQKVGIGVESLQFFGYVATKNGSSAEGFSDAVKHLSKNIDEARQKGGETGAAFTRLGIDVNGAAFKHMNLDEQMELVAKRLSALPDGIAKTSISMQIMGRSGADLIPTMNDLGKHAGELHAAFDEMGGGLKQEQAEALKEFDDKTKTARLGLGMLKDQIVTAIVPALSDLVDSFMSWMRANRDAINEVAAKVADFAVMVVHGFGTVGAELAKAVAWFAKHKDLTIAILIGLGAAIGAFAVEAAVQWALAFWPLIAVAGIVAAVALAVKKLMEWFAGGPITWSKMYSELKQGLKDIEEWFLDIPDKIASAFDRAWEAIKGAAKKAFEWIVNLPVIKQLIEVYDYFAHPASKAQIDEMRKQMPGYEIAKAAGGAIDTAGSAISGAWNKVKGLTTQDIFAPQSAQQSAPIVSSPEINITIHNAQDMNSDELSQKIKDHVTDALEESHRGAFAALTGGVR